MKKEIKSIIHKNKFGVLTNFYAQKNYTFIFIVIISASVLSIMLNENILDTIGIIIIGILSCLLLLFNDNVLLLFTIVFSFLQGFLVEELFLTSTMKYIPDFLAFLIFLKCIYKYFCTKKKMITCFIWKYIFFIGALQIIAFVLNSYNILSFLWALKNWYRFIIIFWGAYYLDVKVKEKQIICLIKVLLLMQVLTTIYEYKTLNKIFMDNPNDRVSGMFGNRGTGIALILLLMLLCFAISRYIHGKDRNSRNVVIVLIVICLQCVLGELRAAFILLPAVIFFMMFAMIVDNSKKKYIKKLLFLSGLFVIGISITFSAYISVYKNFDSIKDIYNQKYLNQTLKKSSYNSDGLMVNRLNGCEKVTKIILEPSHNVIFGVGIGNASPSTKDYLKGNYYKRYGYLKYYFFYLPYFLTENGYAGLFVILLMMMSLFWNSIKLYGKCNNEKWLLLGYQCCIFVIVVTMVYNAAFGMVQVGFTFWTITGLVFRNYNNEVIVRDKG